MRCLFALAVVLCVTSKVHGDDWPQFRGSERLAGEFSASPLLADGKVYLQNEEGTAFVVKADTKFELLARNEMKEKTLASYAASDGAIFLRTAERLYRIEKR